MTVKCIVNTAGRKIDMPVMVLYKDKDIPAAVAESLAEEMAAVTQDLLDAKIEVRAVEPVYRFNANEIHVEMRFRDFGDWSDEQLKTYHEAIIKCMGEVLDRQGVGCTYSFYIIPSVPPRSIWAQAKTGN
jgi:hypothetical protein